jgi:hypothetical protein
MAVSRLNMLDFSLFKIARRVNHRVVEQAPGDSRFKGCSSVPTSSCSTRLDVDPKLGAMARKNVPASRYSMA